MNYLAHAYLSFGNEEILLGNMISDFVKGKKQFLYPPNVHKGILLHRAIDDFTDTHPITQKAKSAFRTSYRLYSGAFIDVVYDHFLAIEQTAFVNDAVLHDFSLKTYRQLDNQKALMPAAFERMFSYMQSQNWLYGYKARSGIYQSFGGLVRRAAYLQDSTRAVEIFDEHYRFLQGCFDEFWPEIHFFARNKMNQLLSDNRTLTD